MEQTIPLVLVNIFFFVGLLGCGPTPSDNRSSHDTPIGVSESLENQTSFAARNAPSSPSTIEVPSISQPDRSAQNSKPLAGSDRRAITLHDLEVQDRLNDLNHWAHEGAPGGILALMPALNDPDERVRTRAEELRRELSAESDADD